ncbi:hypothetical protein [Microtetraspora malaysiensis]|uniref:hypothetical protein n=1 Tax=Microtetraspora malaysiensis TaxID=161358 RepID=UPI003D8A35A8
MIRQSQVGKILTASRAVGHELRHGDPASLSRAVAVMFAAQRNASFEENREAANLRTAELRRAG